MYIYVYVLRCPVLQPTVLNNVVIAVYQWLLKENIIIIIILDTPHHLWQDGLVGCLAVFGCPSVCLSLTIGIILKWIDKVYSTVCWKGIQVSYMIMVQPSGTLCRILDL